VVRAGTGGYDEILLSWKTWIYIYSAPIGPAEPELQGPAIYLHITDRGRERHDQTAYLDPEHWRID